MHPLRKRRLFVILGLLLGVGFAAGLTLFALKKNINLFHTPTQVHAREVSPNIHFRAGGLVRKNSVHRDKKTLAVSFIITDLKHDLHVEYTGILPDLFREGRGVVADGYLNQKGIFIAQEVLAKHDENYMPPPVAASLRPTT